MLRQKWFSRYDEAGNQIYRGPFFSSEDKIKTNSEEEPDNTPQLSLMSAEEAAFWKEVKNGSCSSKRYIDHYCK